MAKLIKQDLADLIEKAKQQKGSLQEGLDLFVSYIKEAEDSLLELVDGEELSPSQRELYEKLDIATFP